MIESIKIQEGSKGIFGRRSKRWTFSHVSSCTGWWWTPLHVIVRLIYMNIRTLLYYIYFPFFLSFDRLIRVSYTYNLVLIWRRRGGSRCMWKVKHIMQVDIKNQRICWNTTYWYVFKFVDLQIRGMMSRTWGQEFNFKQLLKI